MKSHLFYIPILISLTILSWHKILFQSLMGEGFFYFSHGAKEAGFPDIILRYDTGARLAFDLFKVIFKDEIFYYQLLAFLTLVLLSMLFYFLVHELTKRKLLATLASLFFSINFLGLFEMFAAGSYQFFIQRAIYFLLLFPSFIFFVRYLNVRKEYNFIFSLLLYTTSLILSQFSIFFLLFFLTYAFALVIVEKKIYKRVLIHAFLTFIIAYGDILYGSGSLIKGQNFLMFLGEEKYVLGQQLLHQLTVLFVPHQIIQYLREVFQLTFSTMVSFLHFPTLIGSLLIIVYLFVREKTLRVPLVAAAIFIPIVLLLNSYTRGTDFIGRIESGSRYLFVPSIASSIIWAIFFYSLFSIRILFLKVFVVLLVVFYAYSNINVIWAEIDKDFYKHVANKNSFQYIKGLSPSFSEDSLIVVPTNLGFHGSEFSQIFYGKANTTFVPFNSDWHKMLERPFDPKKDFILEYDYKNEKVVDKTLEYEGIIKKKEEVLKSN